MAAVRERSLRLYRSMLRAGLGFTDYNFRSYAVRRVREEFRRNRALAGQPLEDALAKAEVELGVLERQSKVNAMYSAPKSVVESFLKTTAPGHKGKWWASSVTVE